MALRMAGGGSTNNVRWSVKTANVYPGGSFAYSTNAGVSWVLLPSNDAAFQEFSLTPGTPGIPGLLHARHPALLKIVHKRGELTVNEYDTLSSLDEEYLTGQVGLDVESGDTIEATTLPGIKYPYQVR
ncbi:hypothetical protein ES705_38508 [subsurface metagenome]